MTEPRQRYTTRHQVSPLSSAQSFTTSTVALRNDAIKSGSSKARTSPWTCLLLLLPLVFVLGWHIVGSWNAPAQVVYEHSSARVKDDASTILDGSVQQNNDKAVQTPTKIRPIARTPNDKKAQGDKSHFVPSYSSNTNVLAIFMESPRTLNAASKPFTRTTSAAKLERVEFADLRIDCDSLGVQHELPIDSFPEGDPFLPWLHDYHVDDSVTQVRFVAQNKRRCETGEGKERIMNYWAPQMALFQPVPVIMVPNGSERDLQRVAYKLATSLTNATAPETRFLCHFHTANTQRSRPRRSITTFSKLFFNYEYVMWRKNRLPMFKLTGADVSKLEVSQLVFSCPIPEEFRDLIRFSSSMPAVHLDLVPIRTPPRLEQQLFTTDHIGKARLRVEQEKHSWFNVLEEFGVDHVLPDIEDSGRWANLPICHPPRYTAPATSSARSLVESTDKSSPRYHMVACTWTSASYFRRGDVTSIDDTASRLKEWIVFHKLAGVDHFYIYDNTNPSIDQQGDRSNSSRSSHLRVVCEEFPASLVTYIPWPASVCSNNRPNFKNPGERSSQYAADASCRSKYGDQTEWMTFIDTDEYLVPMRVNETWHGILREFETQNVDVLNLRSSRGRPRVDLMDFTDDPKVCIRRNRRISKLDEPTCAVPRRNATFLQVYKYVDEMFVYVSIEWHAA
jgi:Glycosyltransferase family 92